VELDDILQLRKKHPCGSDLWKVVSLGVDVRLECLGCGRVVSIDREKIDRKVKRIVKKVDIK